ERVPSLPAVQPEQLGSLHTLQDVIVLLDQSVSVQSQAVIAPPPAPLVAAPSSLGPLLLEVVAVKTGYPAEMLSLEMSLDHDLGIDSIKRVEILSALQERVPSLPAVQPEQLGSLHTLQDVIALLDQGQSAPASASAPTRGRQPDLTRLQQIQRCIVRPVRVAELGGRAKYEFPAGCEVLVTDDGTELSLRLTEELAARGLKPRLIGWEAILADGATLPAGLLLVAPPQGTTEDKLWHAIRLVQAVGTKLRAAAATRPAFIAAVTRLDGVLGFGDAPRLLNPPSGGLAGLIKTLRHEWPELTTKTIDVSSGFVQLRDAARLVVEELSWCGPYEVGVTPNEVWTLAVEEAALVEAGPNLLQPGDLVVVTGGARGVTSAAAIAVAETVRPYLVVLGRSAEPQAEPDWLAPLLTEAEIKQHLFRQAVPGTSPRDIQQQYLRLMAEREVRQNLAALREQATGVEYHAIDVRDAVAVRGLLQQIQRTRGPIRGVIHGAGVLADQRIEQKTREQFVDVFQTKVQGLFSVLGAVDARELKALVLFSSFTGRYGRTGQVDYAMANEVLNKFGQQFRGEHPHCRVAAFNWGPWDGGMVTPGLKQLFASEGVGLIPRSAGAELVAAELATPADGPAEVVVLGRSGETDSRGPVLLGVAGWQEGRPMTATPLPHGTPSPKIESKPAAKIVVPVIAPAPAAGYQTAFEREIDLHRLPCLSSHVLGGKAVVPMVLVLEWLGHGALHRNPGLEFVGVHELRIFKGLKLAFGEKVQIRVQTGRSVRDGELFRVPVQLVSLVGDRSVLHAAATVLLAVKLPAGETPRLQPVAGPRTDAVGLYGTQLFHGLAFQGLTSVDGCSPEGIAVRSRTAPQPDQWIRQPQRGAWLVDPLVLDAALQALIVWSWQTTGNPCLPSGCAEYRQFRRGFALGKYRVVC
ncbi:MAG TPA: SDR family NAD(P)-dependent oxidoreductase, partial [Planctomycetaceae bacterium]|nr:SDR family NAD(P)-dependent oxidoreductase [Planctomycetaceae bacterium]